MKKKLLLYVLSLYSCYCFSQSNNVALVGNWIDTMGCHFNSLTKSGNYLYAMQWSNPIPCGIGVYNVADPSNPQLVNFSSQTPLNSNGASRIIANGNHLYVTASDTTLRVLDISNPLQLYQSGYYQINGGGYSLGLNIVGNLLYLCCYDKGLKILDITNPSLPNEIGAFILSGGFDAMQVFVSGNYAYVTDIVNKLHILDISNPSSINEISSLQISLPPSGTTIGIGNNIIVRGNYAYIANPYVGFQVVDITNPTTPFLVGLYSSVTEAYDLQIVNEHAYIADYNNGLQVIDISNPSNPVQVGYYYNDIFLATGLYADTINVYLGATNNFYVFNTIPSGLKQNKQSNYKALYPNPTSDFFIITNINKPAIVEIKDIEGRTVLNEPYENKTFDIKHLRKGFYNVRVKENEKSSYIKLIKN